MTRTALFYDEEGKKVSISLQGDHLFISHYSLQYYGLGRNLFKETSCAIACQPVNIGCSNSKLKV